MSTSEAAGTAAGQRRRGPARRLAAIVAAAVVVAAGGAYLGVRLTSGTGPPTSGLATTWTQRIYAVTHCPSGDDQLYQMSLQTGSVLAQTGLQDGSCVAASDYPTLWAADGYLLSGCTGAPTAPAAPDVIIIPAGAVQQRALPWTSTGADNYIENLTEELSPPGFAISGSTLYIGQNLLLHNNSEVDQIAAIDLATARLRWYETISIPGENPKNAVFPVSVIGADSRGVIDVIESVGGTGGDDSGTTGMTLALLSASDGSMSYGPGTTYPAGIDNQPWFTLAGGVLLASPPARARTAPSASTPGRSPPTAAVPGPADRWRQPLLATFPPLAGESVTG